MADLVKNLVTVVTLLCFMIGSGLTIVGIFKTNEMSGKNVDEAYIIPSQVLNGLTVMFLLYLTATSSNLSAYYKLIVIVLLVGGMMVEIYLTSYADREAESIAAYIFIALNFIIRAFILVDLVQGEWIKPVQTVVKESIVKPVQEAVKETIVKPVQEAASEDVGKELISKWDKLKNNIRTKPEGLDRDTENEAWRSIIKPAKESGRKDIKQVLREAVEKLKDKDGNPIPLNSVDAVGGRKRS